MSFQLVKSSGPGLVVTSIDEKKVKDARRSTTVRGLDVKNNELVVDGYKKVGVDKRVNSLELGQMIELFHSIYSACCMIECNMQDFRVNELLGPIVNFELGSKDIQSEADIRRLIVSCLCKAGKSLGEGLKEYVDAPIFDRFDPELPNLENRCFNLLRNWETWRKTIYTGTRFVKGKTDYTTIGRAIAIYRATAQAWNALYRSSGVGGRSREHIRYDHLDCTGFFQLMWRLMNCHMDVVYLCINERQHRSTFHGVPPMIGGKDLSATVMPDFNRIGSGQARSAQEDFIY